MREVSSREKRMRRDAGLDIKAEAEIINKETGKIVNRKTDYLDAVTKWAKAEIYGKAYLKYRTYQMTADS